MQGWIKLHRKALNSTVFAKPVVWKVWCWCLLKASHTKYKLPFGDKDMDIEVGQFVTGRSKAAVELNLTPQQYRTAIKYLKLTNRITIKTTNKFTVITVKKWENYQLEDCSNQQTNQRTTNEQPTSNQRLTTNKNGKKVKNEKKKHDSDNSDELQLSQLLFSEMQKRKPDYKRPNLQKWAVHIDRMIRLDKRDPVRIREVILWCQQDTGNGSWKGWQNNILSTEKLREKFDKLDIAAKAEHIETPEEIGIRLEKHMRGQK